MVQSAASYLVCARWRRRLSMATPIQVSFDSADPDRLATFWTTALGY
jgi:hypothetical protein